MTTKQQREIDNLSKRLEATATKSEASLVIMDAYRLHDKYYCANQVTPDLEDAINAIAAAYRVRYP